MTIHDGLYIISSQGNPMRWNSSTDKLEVVDIGSINLTITDILATIFSIKKVTGHSTHEIKHIHSGKRLHYVDSSDETRLGRGDPTEHTHYRWRFRDQGSSQYKIENVNDSGKFLRAVFTSTSSVLSLTLSKFSLIRISDFENQKVHGKTAADWRHIAHYLLQEGDKVMRSDYAELWEELGDRYGLSLHGSVSKPSPVDEDD